MPSAKLTEKGDGDERSPEDDVGAEAGSQRARSVVKMSSQRRRAAHNLLRGNFCESDDMGISAKGEGIGDRSALVRVHSAAYRMQGVKHQSVD